MTNKLLRVTTSTRSAVAILQQSGSAWTVGHTAPSLAWMRGLDMPAIKQRLIADGAKWEWLPVSEQFVAIAEGYQPTPQRTQRAAKPSPTANVTKGEQMWWNAAQNAIKAEERKAAIVRSARGYSKRKTRATDHA